MVLRHVLDQGLSKSAIARQLGVSRRIVYHWLATGQLEIDLDAPASRRRLSRPTKLDGFTAIIHARLDSYPALSAVRLFEELRAAGYRGGMTQVRDYVARARPRPAPEPVTRFETEPGHQAQVDFAVVDTAWGRRYAFLVVLGYSRLLWVQFVGRQTMAAVMDGLEGAFAYFGGVPRELLFDQMRAVLTHDGRAHDGRLVENADLAAQASHWLEAVANARVHGTTKEVPRVRFERDERAALAPLAARAYQPVLPRARTERVAVRVPRIACLTIDHRPLSQYAALAEAAP